MIVPDGIQLRWTLQQRTRFAWWHQSDHDWSVHSRSAALVSVFTAPACVSPFHFSR